MHAMKMAAFRRAHSRPSTLSRRGFLRFGASALAAGAVVARGLRRPLLASAPADPVPIPIGSFGFHVNAPAFIDPEDVDPVTITNFNGFSGLAYISGMVTRTNLVTHEEDRLPFDSADMRFMLGEYQSADGRMHHGAFGFI